MDGCCFLCRVQRFHVIKGENDYFLVVVSNIFSCVNKKPVLVSCGVETICLCTLVPSVLYLDLLRFVLYREQWGKKGYLTNKADADSSVKNIMK